MEKCTDTDARSSVLAAVVSAAVMVAVVVAAIVVTLVVRSYDAAAAVASLPGGG